MRINTHKTVFACGVGRMRKRRDWRRVLRRLLLPSVAAIALIAGIFGFVLLNDDSPASPGSIDSPSLMAEGQTFDADMMNWLLPADWKIRSYDGGQTTWWVRETRKALPPDEYGDGEFVLLKTEELMVVNVGDSFSSLSDDSGNNAACRPNSPDESIGIYAEGIDAAPQLVGSAPVRPLQGILFGFPAIGRTADTVEPGWGGIHRRTEFCVELNGRILFYQVDAHYETDFGESLPSSPDAIPVELTEGTPALVKVR